MVVCYTMISSQIEEPIAEVVELVDTPSREGAGASRAGSSPAFGTIRCFMYYLHRVGFDHGYGNPIDQVEDQT